METRNVLAQQFLIAALIVTACAWRVINAQYQVAPNLEFITAVSFGAATLGLTRVSVVTPVVISITTSLFVYGPSTIDLFTSSAWIAIGLGTGVMTSRLRQRNTIWSAAPAAATSTFFFLWTNFGVWLTGSMYSRSLGGLLECYVAGLPFYRTMLLGNLLIVPLVVAIASRLRIGRAGASTIDENGPVFHVVAMARRWSPNA